MRISDRQVQQYFDDGFLKMVKDVIILAKLPGFYLDMFIGIVIVFGVVLNQIARKKY